MTITVPDLLMYLGKIYGSKKRLIDFAIEFAN